jgi:hypothetical protein
MGLTLPDFDADKLPSDLGFATHIKNENACGAFITVLPEQFSNSPVSQKFIIAAP